MSPNGWLVGVGGWGFLEQSTTNQVQTMNQQVDFKKATLYWFQNQGFTPKNFRSKGVHHTQAHQTFRWMN